MVNHEDVSSLSLSILQFLCYIVAHHITLSTDCFLLSLQVPKSKINAEWLERDMVSVGVAKSLSLSILQFLCYIVAHHITLSTDCFLLSLQVPKSKINAEWLERDMVSVGVAKVVRDLLYFMRREVLHQQGLFYNTNGNLQKFPELSLYTISHSV